MEEILFIKQYYIYLLIFLGFVFFQSITLSFSRVKKSKVYDLFNLSFAVFTAFYIGGRAKNIGVDTMNYFYGFDSRVKAESFEVDKDVLYEFLSYVISKYFLFNTFLTICALIYVLAAYYGFKKIFKHNYIYAFLIFLISPYFFQFGINVMRNGMAASVFILGLGYYHEHKRKHFTKFIFLISILLHISMIVPVVIFFFSNKIKKTGLIVSIWFFTVLISFLGIQFFSELVSNIPVVGARFSTFISNSKDGGSWKNFLMFGFFPILFGIYHVLKRKINSEDYKKLLNGYLLIHCIYILLIQTQLSLRLSYLSEFMIPILLCFPFFGYLSSDKNRFKRVYFVMAVSLVFLVKAYKVLIVN